MSIKKAIHVAASSLFVQWTPYAGAIMLVDPTLKALSFL